MDEIEVKILEINPSRIRKILKRIGAKLVKDVFQQNSFYLNKHTAKNKITVRVRREPKNTFLTIKANRRVVRGHKVMDEYEMPADYDVIVNILTNLGLKEFGVIEIKREYWRLNDCSVEICEVPKIPIYMEIEGSERNIAIVAKKLGYSSKDYVAGSIYKYYHVKKKFLRFDR
jgi:predicted adenylyl cyclase CyaB